MFHTWMWHLTCQTTTNHRISWILRRDCPVLIACLCTHSTPLILSGMTVPLLPQVKVSSFTWLYFLLPNPCFSFISRILLYFSCLLCCIFTIWKMYISLITEFTVHVVSSISPDIAHVGVYFMPLFHIHIHLFGLSVSPPFLSGHFFLSNVASYPSFFL